MNMRAKFVFSIALLGLLCLMLPGSLRADTIYMYTGRPYTDCYGSYVSTCSTLSLVMKFDVAAGTSLDNLTYTDIASDVTSWSGTDGTGLDLSNTNTTLAWMDIFTDGRGDITFWAIGACSVYPWSGLCPGNWMGTDSYPVSAIDFSITGGEGNGSNIDDPGSWTTPTPEPSSFFLLLGTLLGLLALAARSKRHVLRT
jgi:hypothetical protein